MHKANSKRIGWYCNSAMVESFKTVPSFRLKMSNATQRQIVQTYKFAVLSEYVFEFVDSQTSADMLQHPFNNKAATHFEQRIYIVLYTSQILIEQFLVDQFRN